MTLNKLETGLSQLKGLIYFQNLVPGTQESPFIERYKSEILDDEPVSEQNTERRQLLNEFPPILSFYENQKKKFYEEEATNCNAFCCGGMSIATAMNGDVSMEKQDYYMVSTGSGTLYEGNADAIKAQMKMDIYHQSFGSAEQNQMMGGLKQFESIVTQREEPTAPKQSNGLVKSSSEKSFNPFVTKPDPTNN